MLRTDEAQILALIPAYNEANHIAGVVTGASDFLPVLVVDDGSKDETADRAEAAGAKVLRQQPNQGKGVALLAGFRYALERGFIAVVTLDADGQHDPAEIPKFLDAFADQGADLLIGTRDFDQMPFTRRFANTFGRRSLAWALGKDVPDNQSGYRLHSARMMRAVMESQERGFEFEVEEIVICVEHGYRLGQVPIRTIYAGETSHINGWQHTVNWFRLMLAIRRRMHG